MSRPVQRRMFIFGSVAAVTAGIVGALDRFIPEDRRAWLGNNAQISLNHQDIRLFVSVYGDPQALAADIGAITLEVEVPPGLEAAVNEQQGQPFVQQITMRPVTLSVRPGEQLPVRITATIDARRRIPAKLTALTADGMSTNEGATGDELWVRVVI